MSEMSAFLYLGKMRSNKVTCHKSVITITILFVFCKLVLSFVSILWSAHRDAHLLHRWALLLFLSFLRKDGISWRQFRGEGVNGQRKQEHLIWPGWYRLAGNWAGLCCTEGNHRLRGAASPRGWAIAQPRLEHCVPQYEREIGKHERIVWEGQGSLYHSRKHLRGLLFSKSQALPQDR